MSSYATSAVHGNAAGYNEATEDAEVATKFASSGWTHMGMGAGAGFLQQDTARTLMNRSFLVPGM